MNNLLVTGMSGLIGGAVRQSLDTEATLTALNRSDVEGVRTIQAALDDFEGMRPAFDGQDAVIHLAAKVNDSYGWDELLATNVIGTRNVLEAAREAGVKRVVFTSSGATVSGWERVEPYRSIVKGEYDKVPEEFRLIDETMATRPNSMYGSTKVWGEAIARHYADAHGVELVCLRIGYVNREDKPVSARHYSVWTSQRDVVNAIRLALTVDLDDGFDVLFILSNNKWGYRNIGRAVRVLGYQPRDAAEDHR